MIVGYLVFSYKNKERIYRGLERTLGCHVDGIKSKHFLYALGACQCTFVMHESSMLKNCYILSSHEL